MNLPLAGLTIGVTAERRAHQQQRYLEARGATVVLASVLKTVDHTERPEVIAATHNMIESAPDILVVQTGQGLRWWLEAMEPEKATALLGALASTEIWCRGAKASSACKKLGLTVAWQASEETTADVCRHLEAANLTNMVVALQLDGNDPAPLLAAAEGAATVVPLDVYGYRLPEILDPALALIDDVIDRRVQAVTFTASPAIHHLRQIAALAKRPNAANDLDRAFNGAALAALVGPVCAATARQVGWTNFVEPPTARLIPMLETLQEAMTAEHPDP